MGEFLAIAIQFKVEVASILLAAFGGAVLYIAWRVLKRVLR